MRWFVSRHPGAIQWAKAQAIPVDRFVTHLDIQSIQKGDHVIGNLPIHLAEQICLYGARYFHLSLDLPPELRGQELSAEQLNELKAEVREYMITRI
ncbi:CRISPR-associated protein Csx16 [Vibrio sp. MarTm2]|uniref:CRISPR-associated protein Csx16 n=1 Tax=Vibrio sp. MarTm2 TaxID=2998831 RepID=UPI0022CD6B2E|nr:CRISPR-associated protein Csx16 [Vibrio sp. MarTm2]MDA0129467.1 CRISPR-associated protein Csx16 [Vibrio sp. MarTm2]